MRLETGMGFAAAVVATGLICAAPGHADVWYDTAALQCDVAHNTALVRIGGHYNEDQDTFPDLPATYAASWNKVADPGNTRCKLANGEEIVLKMHVGQAFAYGAGGADPPVWISLWIDNRQLLSDFQVSPGYDDRDSRAVNSLIYRPGSLRICDRESDSAIYDKHPRPPVKRDSDGCYSRVVNKAALRYDSVQAHNRKAAIGTITVAATYSPVFCRRFIFPASRFAHGPRDDALRIGSKEVLSYKPLVKADLLINDFGTDTGMVDDQLSNLSGHLNLDYFDFDNDGVSDTVIKAWDNRHYMDGELYLVKAGRFPEAVHSLAKAKSYTDWAKANGFSVYSGNNTLYQVDRYTHLSVFRLEGATYLIATPTLREQRPSAILYKPLPDGEMDELCIYQAIEEKY